MYQDFLKILPPFATVLLQSIDIGHKKDILVSVFTISDYEGFSLPIFMKHSFYISDLEKMTMFRWLEFPAGLK